MIAYVDTSVILRKLLGEPDQLGEWSSIDEAYSSRLLLVELGRVIDRYRLLAIITDAEVATLHEQAQRLVASIDLVALSEPILERAGDALPTIVGSLDGLHLATAIEARARVSRELVFATHDGQLATAARASGFAVVGGTIG